MKLVLFDADGTLIDSQAIIHESMRLTFESFAYQAPAIQATKSIIGLTLDYAIASILERDVDDEILAMTAAYKENFIELAKRPDMQTLAFAGMPQLVRSLAERDDVLLGLVTGKSRRGVEKLFDTSDFSNCFVTSRCADDCPSKPHPAMVLECCNEVGVNPADTVVVGDTSFDMEMANAAGASSVGVTWGYHSSERLVSAGAQYLVGSSSMLQIRLKHFMDGFVDRLADDHHASPGSSPDTLPDIAVDHTLMFSHA